MSPCREGRVIYAGVDEAIVKRVALEVDRDELHLRATS